MSSRRIMFDILAADDGIKQKTMKRGMGIRLKRRGGGRYLGLIGSCFSGKNRRGEGRWSENLKPRRRCPNDSFRVKASMARQYVDGVNLLASRREVIGLVLGVPSIFLYSSNGKAAGLPPEEKPRLCDDACVKELENVPMVTTPSGLQYKDIVVGGGPSPPVGFQVAANYVAMVPSGQIFDSSLEKGVPYIFRVGSGQVVPGLDEGILSMKVGGKRRLYIPGTLAFPKGLTSAPGRPRVAPNSPVVFDVSLEFIPGLDDEE